MLLDKLFENLALNVDPFATCRVADGWRLRLPSLDWVTLHYVLHGDAELKLGSGETLGLPSGALAVIPPGLAHALQCGSVRHVTGIAGQGDPKAALSELVAGPLEQLRVTVACGRIQAIYASGVGLFEHLKQAIVIDFSDSLEMRTIFEALLQEYDRSGPGSAAMMTALMNQCLIRVLRCVSEQADGALPWLSALDDPHIGRVVETILDHPERAYTLELLADIAHMSRSTFVRHFIQCFGRTPMAYVRDVRLRHAARLLQVSGLSIERVARNVGFASRSHFSRAFSDRFGGSPAEFRRQHH